MNLRKVKLALTVDLLNTKSRENLLNLVKEKMLNFRQEVGKLIEQTLIKKSPLVNGHIKQSYIIKYENCTLDIDLITNPNDRNQYVYTFELQP